MPKIPGGVLGSYNGVVLRFYMEREESFYLIKVLSIIVMLTGNKKKKYLFFEIFFFFNYTTIVQILFVVYTDYTRCTRY